MVAATDAGRENCGATHSDQYQLVML